MFEDLFKVNVEEFESQHSYPIFNKKPCCCVKHLDTFVSIFAENLFHQTVSLGLSLNEVL